MAGSEGGKCKKAKSKYVPNPTRQAERKARKLVKHFKKVGGDDRCARKAFDGLPPLVKNKFKALVPEDSGRPGKRERIARLKAEGRYHNGQA